MLRYSPETGQFIWAKQCGRRRSAGDAAGGIDAKGYWRISIDGKAYFAHRLAWLYEKGEMPSGHLDHINGDRLDNRVSNLREATSLINNQNRRAAHKGSATGLLGVTKRNRGGYRAFIRFGGKQVFLGYFETPELAHAAYIAAKRLKHAGCTI